MKWKVIPMS